MKILTKEQFADARQTLGLTQQQFAEKIGYDRFLTVLRKEKGHTPITMQDTMIIDHLLRKKESSLKTPKK